MLCLSTSHDRAVRRAVRPLAAALALALCAPGAAPARADDAGRAAYFETFAPDGTISMRAGTSGDQAPTPLPKSAPSVVPMHADGPAANRIGLVFVGDGYTAAEQQKFASAAEQDWQALTSFEPYKTYRNFFNATRVELVSPVSGISDDPAEGVSRATPLGMHFWCHDIQRLLCVDTTAAADYGKQVAGHNLVIAVANTTTYGGAGGGITTVAGGNADSSKIIIHELAHTLAGLGDEYDVPYDTATGSTSPFPNVSSQNEAGISSAKAKWWRWLGAASGDGSRVGAYEGANYYKHGFWRPSNDSDMRTLGVPFNPPSAESLVEAFYAGHGDQPGVSPVDSVTPATTDDVRDPTATLSIVTVPLVGADYKITWTVGGTAVPGTDGARSLKLSDAPLTPNQWNQVTVTITDPTPMVRDEAFRTASMTQTRTWRVWGGSPRPAPAPPLQLVERVFGGDRESACVAASQWGYTNPGVVSGRRRTAKAAVLARDDIFVDSVSAAALAAHVGGPLLLTAPAALDARVGTELRRTLTQGSTVYLVGGTNALSPAVAASVQQAGFRVVRLPGSDEFGTAVSVADSIAGTAPNVLLVTGTDAAEGLTAGAAAGSRPNTVVLLTNGATMPSATAAWLAAHPGGKLWAIGPAAVTAAAGRGATALAGADRYATAALVAQTFFTRPAVAAIASADSWADALCGGAMVDGAGGPLLLSTGTALSAPTAAYLRTVSGSVTDVVVVGATATLGDAVLKAAGDAISAGKSWRTVVNDPLAH